MGELERKKYLERLALEERKRELQDGLGYKYAHKLYTFQREFIESTNKMNLLVAANQLGKSSSGIMRCCHHMFTSDEERVALWPKYMPGKDKLLMWYFYPDFSTATTAFHTVWQKYLPSGVYLEEDELKQFYGWEARFEAGKVASIKFRNGFLEFKGYNQSILNLQSASCYEVFTDEEIPYKHYPEITSRMNYTDGYYNMVFTATRGEQEWYRAMERQGKKDELFPHAKKWNVSLWDCQKYDDGTPSPWTKQKIIHTANKYSTDEEVMRRIEGRFVVDTKGLVYSAYKNEVLIEPHKIPYDWDIRCGIDIGSGGDNHKSAITFIAVRPDYKAAIVINTWRKEETTTPDEVLEQYKIMKKGIPGDVLTFYDYHAKDFEILVNDDPSVKMIPADKKPEHYIGIVNTLMKNNMLHIFNRGDADKMVGEMRLVRKEQPKNKRVDDLCFTKGQKVATGNGYVNIEDLKIGDMVFTRKGFKKIINVGSRYAKVKVFCLKNKRYKCTPNHKFITDKGLCQVQSLTNKDTLIYLNIKEYLRCLKDELNKLSIKELFTGDIQRLRKNHIGDILKHLELIKPNLSIGRFGKILMAKFLKVFIYTIKMVIIQIIILKTWLLFLHQNIYQNILKNIILKIKIKFWSILKKLESFLKNGMLRKRGWNGIEKTAKNLGVILKNKNVFVLYVGINFWRKMLIKPNIVLENVQLNSGDKVALMMNTDFVNGVKKNIELVDFQERDFVEENVQENIEKVYNITVEDQHEYFINNTLVANCDSLLYSLSRIVIDFSGVRDDSIISTKEYLLNKKEKNDMLPERSLDNFHKKQAERARKEKEEALLYEGIDDYIDNVFSLGGD